MTVDNIKDAMVWACEDRTGILVRARSGTKQWEKVQTSVVCSVSMLLYCIIPQVPYQVTLVNTSTIRKSVIKRLTYVCSAWEFAADTHLLKLQCLQNKDLHTSGNFPRHTPVCELHKAFNIPYIYDYITKLCRKQAEIIQNHGNANVCNIGQGKP
jgi:hypothetical protein